MSKSIGRTSFSYGEEPVLAEVGDTIQFARIANEGQWSGKVARRSFVYHEEGVTVFFDLEKKVPI